MSGDTYQIDADFELIGAFWIPDAKGDITTGTMKSKKGSVEIVTSPQYRSPLGGEDMRDALLAMNMPPESDRVPIVHGFVSKQKCTLFNSLVLGDERSCLNFPLDYEIRASRLLPTRTILGLHAPSSDDPIFDSGVYSFTKLHRIFPRPWTLTLSETAHSITLPNGVKEVFRVDQKETGVELIGVVRCGSPISLQKGFTKRPHVHINVKPSAPRSLDWFNALAFRLENFFTLFLGTSVSITHLTLRQKDESGSLVHHTRRRKEKVNRQLWIQCSFQVIADALNKWLGVPEEHRAVELTVLGVVRKSNLFMETEFLSLTQALEGFGRISLRLKPSESPTFETMLQRAYDLLALDFAGKLLGNKNDFVQTMLQTRNFYTHLGNTRGPKVLQHERLFFFNHRLQAFIRCILLLNLGVPEDVVRSPILYQAKRWGVH